MSQHDMDLANAAGASFRSDANAALLALVSNSSGATAPSTTYAYQFWADTSAGLLKMRNAANSAWLTVCDLASGAPYLGAGASLVFEGTTDDAFETTLAVTDPTADRTATFPDQTGTVKLMARGSDIASAATINLSTATGDIVDVTGTTAITAITLADGIERTVRFTGALTLTHGASLVLPSAANISTAAGDIATFRGYAAGVVRCTSYMKASGQAIVGAGGITLATMQASTSGTSIDFTSIPAGTKRIVINFVGVSTSGTSNPLIQLGKSGGPETSGYLGAGSDLTTGANFTTGFGIPSGLAANVLHGTVVLSLVDAASNTWAAFGILAQSNTTSVNQVAGSKSLAGTLDRVRITTVGGSDTFDAGNINIQYE